MEIEDIRSLEKGKTYWVRVKSGCQHRMIKNLRDIHPEQRWIVTDDSCDFIHIPTVARDQLIKLAKALEGNNNGKTKS